MKVADLQGHLDYLAALLDTAKAGSVAAKDLRAIRAGLEPFAGLELPEFAAFLALADEYKRNGKVETPAGKGKGGGKKATAGGGAKAPAADPLALKAETLTLFDRAPEGSVTDVELDDLARRLGTLKRKDDLMPIAESLGISPKGLKAKPIAKMVEEIRRAIEDRQGSKVRAGMHRPHVGGPPIVPAVPESVGTAGPV
jgi:hypothetical protein